MNKIFGTILFLSAFVINAQVKIQSTPEEAIVGQNPFIDASGYGKDENSLGKGLYFPQTDLTQWIFNTEEISRSTFNTAFDGMIVYNTASGKTGANPDTQGVQVDVEPGFYYFYNPTGSSTRKVTEGKWVRIGGAAEAKRTTASGKEIFTQKGEFTLTTGDNGTSILFPEGMTSLYSIKIYRKDGDASHLVGSSLYTYKLNAGEGQKNIIFGTGIISTAYPAGTYEYEMEYIQ